MKKPLFAVMVVGLIWLGLPGEKISVGVFGGLNLSNLKAAKGNPYGVDPDDFKQQTVFGIGGVVEIPLNSFLSLRIQPMVLKRQTFHESKIDFPYHYAMSYLEVPVLLKWASGDTVRPYALAGASIGYHLRGEARIDEAGVRATGDLGNIVKKTNLSLVVGAGVSYDLGAVTLFLDGLYFVGITQINNGGPLELDIGGFITIVQVDPLEVRTRDVLLTAGIRIPLGKRSH